MIEQVKNNFTQVPNRIIDDKGISDRAKTVYVMMRRCGPDWDISVRVLATMLGKSHGTVAHALKELEEKGYIERFQTRSDGSRFAKMEYRVLNAPHTDPPNADNPQAKERDDIKHYRNNTVSDKTFIETDYLTADLSVFEDFFHRSLMPSEKVIWERWVRDGVDSRFIETAVKDSEYLRERLSLEYVDEKLKEWKKNGLNTLVDVNNYILEAKYRNTEYKIISDSHGELDKETVASKTECSKVASLRHWRDALIMEHKADANRFEMDAFSCPTDVFKYLAKDVLAALIALYEGKNDAERLSAAKQTMKYMWKE